MAVGSAVRGNQVVSLAFALMLLLLLHMTDQCSFYLYSKGFFCAMKTPREKRRACCPIAAVVGPRIGRTNAITMDGVVVAVGLNFSLVDQSPR
jgi:hypothetical protein